MHANNTQKTNTQKINIFILTVPWKVYYKRTTAGMQELASSEQARRVADEAGGEVGDGAAEGSSAAAEGWQAAASLRPDRTASGSSLEPDAQLCLWKCETQRFISRGFTVNVQVTPEPHAPTPMENPCTTSTPQNLTTTVYCRPEALLRTLSINTYFVCYRHSYYIFNAFMTQLFLICQYF